MAKGPTSAAQIAAANMLVDVATAEVLRAFDSAGVETILIKGISTTRWLSTWEAPRLYGDCDLLVNPADQAKAEQVLRQLGLSPAVSDEKLPEWWREHATAWSPREAGNVAATIDLHRNLAGVEASPEDLWKQLSQHTEAISVAEHSARALTIPGRAFVLALHAAQHGSDWEPALKDLQRALDVAGEPVWRAAAELAASVNATDAFSAGLRLIPDGAALADRLELPADVSVDVAIRAKGAVPVALGLDQLARARGLRGRLSILRHKFFPPVTFMRHWFPRARDGWPWLILAYIWRPIWLLLRLPRGFAAWVRARRSHVDST